MSQKTKGGSVEASAPHHRRHQAARCATARPPSARWRWRSPPPRRWARRREIFAGPAINAAALRSRRRARAAPRPRRWSPRCGGADGVIFSSPGYHGSVSGLLKNAIDYAEDMRADARVYLADRAIGIIVCADGIQAMGSTLNALRSIAHALRAWPTPFAAVVNSGARPFGADGACQSAEVEQSLRLVAAQVVEFAQMRIARPSGERAERAAERRCRAPNSPSA